ncbi:NTP/NDP exchange transporter [Candidatus Sororendozoicomonas aggregata]|uniref:NTP/NDP exchange transporter n=1 Tax=Candidatus Sororendozoicomonas aggregata TaxID=3073239 RepID=UPI002ED5AD4C
MSNNTEFGKWRSRLWPVHGYELKKVIPMVLIFFLVLFNYQILRDIKDALVVTSAGSGAEVIPFLKFWGVLPGAVLFVMLYMQMSNRLSKQNLFYCSVLPFTFFFAIFPFIYAFREVLHPTDLADKLQAMLPQGFMGLIAIFRNWTCSLFYIMSELWGSVALSLLFWGFANDTNKISESKRFYPLFGLLGNLSLPAAGAIIIFFGQSCSDASSDVDRWQSTLNFLMLAVVLGSIMIMIIYGWMHRYVFTDSRFINTEPGKKKKVRPQMGMWESLKYLASSKYLCLLSILIVGYGFSINLIEVTWKNQLKLQYPDPSSYLEFMGLFTSVTGIAAIFMMLFVGGNIIRRFGWTVGALFTPVVLLFTGACFFICVLGGDFVNGLVVTLGTTPLMLAVIFGMAQNVMSKSSKYSLFDPTKEMAYIPLDEEQKVKGKAALDVVGARMGKSGGSLVQQGLIITFGTISAITPYLGAILLVVILVWGYAAFSLGHRFKEKAVVE